MTQIEDSLDDIVTELNELIPIVQGIETGVDAKKAELELAVNDALAFSLSNPNLFDNPDFTIDQRGIGTGSVANTNHLRDRWRNWSGLTTNVTVTGGANNRQIAANGALRQEFEENIWGGVYVTFSIEDLDVDLVIYVGIGVSTTIPAGAGKQSVSIIGDAGTGADNRSFFMEAVAGTSVAYSFKNLKIELGEVATAWIPPHPQVEFAKCQRHFEVIDLNGMDLPTAFWNNNVVQTTIPMKAVKYTVPTATVVGTFKLYNRAASSELGTVSSSLAGSVNKGFVKMRLDGDGFGASAGYISCQTGAEITIMTGY